MAVRRSVRHGEASSRVKSRLITDDDDLVLFRADDDDHLLFFTPRLGTVDREIKQKTCMDK